MSWVSAASWIPSFSPPAVPARTGRRRFAVAAAPPPFEEAVRATDTGPLTKGDLITYLASGCKPQHDWRIGTEHEKFGFHVQTLRPIDYDQISQLFNVIADRFGWYRVMEGNKVIGLKQGLQSISLEAGGQIELSGGLLETIHQTCAEINSHLYQIKAVGEEMGIGFLGLGFQPKWSLTDMPMMPKARYEILENYLPKVGSFGLDVMFRTCTVQVNLDFSSEQDMIKKFRASLALQPIATAIFANSSFKEGQLNGFHSFRSHLYTDLDNDRTGMLPFVFDRTFGFERYVEYALDVPMYFVYRNKKHIDCTGMSFRDFMDGKLPQVPGERPTLNDWEYHLGTIYPEVGILYDEESLQNITDMIADWTNNERNILRREVPVSGLKTQFRGGYVRDLAEHVVKLAKEGLQRRGHKEVDFLNEVDEIVRTGVTPAERLTNLYKTNWQHNVDMVFRELAY